MSTHVKDVKLVCIVGAGTAGLVAVKECLHEGFQVVCFELDCDIAGIWLQKADSDTSNTPKIWKALITNTTKYLHAFSDFPPSLKQTPYFTAKALHNYYRSYAEHFKLLQYIHFNTRVVQVRRAPDYAQTGKWEVFSCPTKDFNGGDKMAGVKATPEDLTACKKDVFDFVIIASGFFKIPKYPEIAGLDTFTGTVQHSFTYSTGKAYEDKNVIVVGNSVSAGDIAVDIANYSSQVHLALGKGTWIWPRIMTNATSLDHSINRATIYSSDMVVKVNDFLMGECQNRMDHIKSGVAPGTLPLDSCVMTGDDIYLRIMSGRIQARGYLKSVSGSTAYFDDGSHISNVDAIVCCTGYKPDLSFVDMNIIAENGKMELFKMMIPLNEKHNTICLLGLFGADAPLSPTMEAQARYAAKLFAGKLTLPPSKVMKDDIEFWNQFTLKRRGGNYNYLLPATVVTDSIHALLGSYPSFWRIFFRDPVLAFRVWYGPFFSSHYRLLGPDSNWQEARRISHLAYSEGIQSAARHRRIPKVTRPDVYEARKRRLLNTTMLAPILAAAFAYFVLVHKSLLLDLISPVTIAK